MELKELNNSYCGCGDNNCLVVKPKGMATNGGCRCHDGSRRAKEAIVFMARKIYLLEKKIDELEETK